MACCPPRGAEPFTQRNARRDARRYRRRGLDPAARRLADEVEPVEATVLEIGGGIGALQLELLRRGASRTTNVELSPAYEPQAEALLREHDVADRVERCVLDFAAAGSVVPAADVVVMHRVVCCSPDLDGLLGAAADHARQTVALSFPRDTRWLRLGAAGLNLLARLLHWDWRFYVRPPAAIRQVLERHGFASASANAGPIWQTAAFTRRTGAAAAS